MSTKCLWRNQRRGGFTLVETLVAMVVVGILFVALYTGLTFGFSTVQYARENQRATQILIEKMETMRLYNWDQITSSSFIPDKFTASYMPVGTTNTGVVYEGTVKIKDVKNATNYDDGVRLVTVSLTWKTGKLTRQRSLSTYVSQFGMHDYYMR